MKKNKLKIILLLSFFCFKVFSETEIIYIKPKYIGCTVANVAWVERLEREGLGRYWLKGYYLDEQFFKEIKKEWATSKFPMITDLKEKGVKYFIHQTITKDGDNYTIDFSVEDVNQKSDVIVLGVFRGSEDRFKKWFELSILCNIKSLAKGNNPNLKHTINIGRMSMGASNIYKISWHLEEELLSANINSSKFSDNFYVISYAEKIVDENNAYKKINGILNDESTELQIKYNEKKIAPKIQLSVSDIEKRKCIQGITQSIIAEILKD